MADIFISYSRKDSEHAKMLADRLRSSGASVWMDTASLAAAETWSGEIVRAIKECTALVVLLSPRSVASANVTKEVGLASEKRKIIIPIVIEKCELTDALEYALAGLHHVSLFDEIALLRSFEKLATAGQAPLPAGSATRSDSTMSVYAAAAQPSAASGLLRIAVLPFEDQSPAHDHEWFSDGLTDELISTLNKLDKLVVLDRNSSKIYKDAKLTTKQIAAELQVRYIITGAVRKAGERIRIQASLIEAESGAMIWDEKFNGTMEDIFEIQEKTARDIVEGLKITLTPEEKTLLDEKMTDSPEVYELLLQAARKVNVEKEYWDGLALTEQALAIDPDCIQALYVKSINLSNLYRVDNNRDPGILERERMTVKQLSALGPETYYCLAARANYYLNIGESDLAVEMAERAMRAMPKRARAHSVLGFIYSRAGKQHQAAAAFRKALELDPNSGSDHVRLLTALYSGGASLEELRAAYPAAKQYLEERVEEFPNNIAIRMEYLNASVQAQMADDGVATAEYVLSHHDVTPDQEYCCAEPFLQAGDIERGHALLRSAISRGQSEFSKWDEAGFIALKGTPEYDFLVAHIVKE
ncbi:MAG: TIR domain-containing protein [Bacteroidota bacterium]|nr:TIR domain-containing protein [Bacteroidota bacterium]MDP4230570.1 TIR domain-containing protein [Bacteroidota bacterium]MDP4235806.1 TIR domain-containing protein [Bacteroidota bacterium]